MTINTRFIENKAPISPKVTGTGNYSTLYDLNLQKRCRQQPFIESRVVTVSNAEFVLINNTVLPGKISLGTSTEQVDGGISVSALPGVVGTAHVGATVDSSGNIWNLVDLRIAATHDLVKSGEQQVYGLLHCSNTATDGDAITPTPSENVQMDFVVRDGDDTLSSVIMTGTYEFTVNKVYVPLTEPTEVFFGSNGVPRGVDLAAPSKSVVERVLTVTTGFALNEVITISTGSGATSGASTPEGNTVSLPASSSAFIADHSIEIKLNNITFRRTGATPDVIWDSTNSFHFNNLQLDPNDVMIVKVQI